MSSSKLQMNMNNARFNILQTQNGTDKREMKNEKKITFFHMYYATNVEALLASITPNPSKDISDLYDKYFKICINIIIICIKYFQLSKFIAVLI